MTPTILTLLQLFGIGFSFGVAGPCLFSCTPALIAYLTAQNISWKKALGQASLFFIGRFIAYVLLGFAAGFSGKLFHTVASPYHAKVLHSIGGIIIIFFGVFILFSKTRIGTCFARSFSITSLFGLGFVIGFAPCAPLIALLVEISLMSQSGVEGIMYAASFGIGTSFAGMLVIAVLSGMLNWIPRAYFENTKRMRVFRVLCGLLLIGWGLYAVMRVQ